MFLFLEWILQSKRYLFLQDAGDLPQRSVQARHSVVGPLPAVLALQLLQQVLHHALQPEHTRAHMEKSVYKLALIHPDRRPSPNLYSTVHNYWNYWPIKRLVRDKLFGN